MDHTNPARLDNSGVRHLILMVASFCGVIHPLALPIEGWLAGLRRHYGGNIDVIGLLDPVYTEIRELNPVAAWERLIAELDRLEVQRVEELSIKFTAAELVAHAEKMGRQASEVLAERQQLEADAEQEQHAAVDAAIRDGRACTECRHIWQVGEASRPAGFGPSGQLFRCSPHCGEGM
ncbi:hypothetical protein [Nocardia mangyaensis]|uniref:hypothetical protein n=1 Tax=Nocardia mangyaensis TaxID=2213200 RepID=UPI002676AE6C|nr:hypothetical protein [Nocardia mangyaensis]MDO3647673.1 hypothetical protein [Nocardia mangyaensis]